MECDSNPDQLILGDQAAPQSGNTQLLSNVYEETGEKLILMFVSRWWEVIHFPLTFCFPKFL